MTAFDLAAMFLAIIGAVSWLNAKVLRLPPATLMVVAGLLGAVALLLLRTVWPEVDGSKYLITAIIDVDFSRAVLSYILAFLLFAGAMQVDLAELSRRAVAVFSLPTLGVVASIAIVGLGIYSVANLFALPLSLPWALVFGALISPTDPIAVIAAVRQGGLSKPLVAILQGEALFNDGVGIVVFTALSSLAASGGSLDPVAEFGHVAVEAAGALILGGSAGWMVTKAMRAIDEYAAEVILTLGLATGAYALASALHLSAPLCVVTAGLIVGDRRRAAFMSDTTQRYVRGFGSLIDEILNAVLFLLLGLELLVIEFDLRLTGLWVAAIALVLAARFVVVLPWGAYFHIRKQEKGASFLLAWGGLHGALSLALALSLPRGDERSIILSMTFAVVMFSVLVQGLTFGHLSARLGKAPAR